jgi:hypothetical protein
MNVIIKLQNLKPNDLKYLQKPNLDVTKPKLLHLYSNMTHTHESKCNIWKPHTIIQTKCHTRKTKKKWFISFCKKSFRGLSSINCYNI